MSTRLYHPASVARMFLYVREAQSIGQNRGLRVEAIQHWTGGEAGESWCMDFAWMVFDICYQGQCPFDRVRLCEDFRKTAVKNGWVVTIPMPGDIVLSLRADGTAHHVGIITNVSPLTSIAGNTSEDGSSDNGDRVAEKYCSPTLKLYVRVPADQPLQVAA